MSAFLCSAEHISHLVNVAETIGHKLLGSVEHTFRTLAHENGLSLGARYGTADGAHDMLYCATLRPTSKKKLLLAEIVAAIKLIHCYQYQSCEHEGWAQSEAKQWTDGLLRSLTYELPGYTDASWGI